jgi:thiol:disulfide interchange protein DsbA
MRTLIRGVLAALALSAFACSAQEPAAQYELGKQYNKVRQSEAPTDAKRILVQEFFWYGCPHCYALDPQIEAWKKTKPADADFVRVPNSLGRPQGIIHSKTFYTEEVLNVYDKMHKQIFDGIHQERIPLDTQAQMQQFFTDRLGMMPDVFNNTFTGFTVDARVRRAEELAQKYAVSSVPTIVVGGVYYTNSTMAGDFPKLLAVVNFLIDKVRKERAGK